MHPDYISVDIKILCMFWLPTIDINILYLIPRRIIRLSRNVPTAAGFFALNQAATSAKTAGTASVDNIAKRAVCCYDTAP